MPLILLEGILRKDQNECEESTDVRVLWIKCTDTTDAESAHGCQHPYEISNNYSSLVL